MPENKYTINLNQEQKEAVLHGKGPLLIVAGAGTGKTTAITHRLANLIQSGLAQSQEILAVTFTDKAAGEMEERVDRLLPFGYLDLWVSTFHSFCERILKEHGLDIGLPTNFKLLDQTGSWVLVRQNLDKFNLNYYRPLGNPGKFIHALIDHFGRCKDEAIFPEDYLQYADDIKRNFDDGVFGSRAGDREDKITQKEAEIEQQRISELADAYHTYQRLLLENNALDFGDLINYCLKLFKERPTILDKYRSQFKYILVDEFQDTNWAQYELIKTLAGPANNLTASADDDQSVFRFIGASFNNVLQFKKDFPQSKEIVLKENYRSTQNILNLACNFIQLNNPNRLEYQLNQDKELAVEAKEKGVELSSFKKIDKKLKASDQSAGLIEHLHFATLEQEAEGVAKKIAEIINNDKEANFSDFAVLVRANDSATAFFKEFERQRIPYEFLASKGLYSQPVILDIISYFRMLDNYHESPALNRLLGLPFLNVPAEVAAKINQHSKKRAQSTYETLQELSLVKGVSKESAQKIGFLVDLIKNHSKLIREKTVGDIFLAFLNDSGYLKYIVKQENDRDIGLVTQFYKKIKSFEENSPEPTLTNFMQAMDMELESGEAGSLEADIEKGPDAVKIMTIHSAKGLEFKYVFIVNLVDKRFPTIERKEPIEIPDKLIKEIVPSGDIHLQEERRLFYVAMTRAKRGLFFTSADDYGGTRKKKLSRFLGEINFKKPEAGAGGEVSLKPVEKGAEGKKSYNIPPYFSYSQFAAFDKCPLQYKFAHILRVPCIGTAVFSFGKTIHRTLRQFLENYLADQRKNQKELFRAAPDEKDHKKNDFSEPEQLKRIMAVYEANWIDEWYENKKQKQAYCKLGKEILKDFLERFLKEQPKIKFLDGRPSLELDFSLKIGENTIKGKIDRVDELPDGGIEVIDYKTGRGKEKLAKEDKEQLMIYQLAGEQIFKETPECLSYYYLENSEKKSFQSSEEERGRFKQEVLNKIEKIKNSDFKATPGWQCQFCDFKNICEFRKL